MQKDPLGPLKGIGIEKGLTAAKIGPAAIRHRTFFYFSFGTPLSNPGDRTCLVLFRLSRRRRVLADDDGVEFPNVELAARESARAAAEIVRDSILMAGKLQEIAVEIRN